MSVERVIQIQISSLLQVQYVTSLPIFFPIYNTCQIELRKGGKI